MLSSICILSKPARAASFKIDDASERSISKYGWISIIASEVPIPSHNPSDPKTTISSSSSVCSTT